MRADQLQKVDALAEQVMDVFISEADPKSWTGSGLAPAQMTPEVRGARNWDMKNANQAGALALRVLELKDRIEGLLPSGGPGADDRADDDIAKFEKQAKKLLESVSSRRGAG